MKKYKEVPQWWYLLLFVASLAIGIGCSVRIPKKCSSAQAYRYIHVQYNHGEWLLPAWLLPFVKYAYIFIAQV